MSLAIKESLQFFVNDSGEKSGNILIFTDAEETDGGIDIEVPDGVSVGVVGVGTARGGPVPIRDSKGVFRGNKKYQGKVVVSKLDENFLKKLGAKLSNFKYWVATSYSLPTEQILNFFSGVHEKKNEQNSFRVRPVLTEYLMIPGLILLGLSFLIGRRKMFIMNLIFILMTFSMFAIAEEEPEKKKSEKTLQLEGLLISGELSKDGKVALASSLLNDDFPEQAAQLYSEVLDPDLNNSNIIHKLNQATSYLKSKKVKEGIDGYNKLIKYLEKNPSKENDELLKITKSNISKLFQPGQQGSKGKKKEKNDNQDKDDDQDSENESGEGGDPKDSDQKDQDKKEDGKNKDKKDDKDSSGQDKKDQKKKKSDKKESKDQKNKRKKKLPALLKQLLNDDNQLQKKLIDAKTTKRKGYGAKDW